MFDMEMTVCVAAATACNTISVVVGAAFDDLTDYVNMQNDQ